DEVLARCSHVLSQGGAFTSAAAFSAGRPQLIVPLHNEALLNGEMLRQLGVARLLDPEAPAETAALELRYFLDDIAIVETACEQARRIAGRPLPDGREA